MNVFQFYSILINLIILFLASSYDIKTRKVPNHLWIFDIVIQIGIAIIYLGLNYSSLTGSIFMIFILNFWAVFIFSYFLYRNKAWGGADSKAVILLICTSPYFYLGWYTNYENNFLPLIVPFVIIFNLLLAFYSVTSFFYRFCNNTKMKFRIDKLPHKGLPGLVFITLTYVILIFLYYNYPEKII